MNFDEVVVNAAREAVALFEAGFAIERGPEDRVRQAFIASLQDLPTVAATKPELGKHAEFRPHLPDWPNVSPKTPLGGFDLAVRLTGDDGWRYLFEFKWDALWMCLWDLFKLTHACRLNGVEATYMAAIATEGQWSKPTECAELFRGSC